jgi:hypothetical protein
MGTLLAIVLIYVFGMYALLRFGLPLLFFGGLFLASCCGQVAILLGRALWWFATIAVPIAISAAGRAALFIRIVWQELRSAEHTDGADNHEDDAGPAATDHYGDALTVLRLGTAFTREQLNTAYKIAIRKAHPDAGGSLQDAQAVNAARDIILHQKGWARS